MTQILLGGLANGLQCLAYAAPTFLIGLFIASLLRYYLGPSGTRRLFGGDTWLSLPQSWLIGMLLPVCSVGVLPMLREMRRAGVRPGALTAFALSAPLFNPLSLLYGLTLSRPYVICGFALASLVVVTILGIIWDRIADEVDPRALPEVPPIVGLRRLVACFDYCVREVFGPSGALALVASLGIVALAMVLPHGALQTSVEQDDPFAPARMALVAIPIYATPMTTMSQLGMMFAHGNSPGAAFCLLLLGTGVNVATLVWFTKQFGFRSTSIWFISLVSIVILCAYSIDQPLIPVGVEPAGHTHAFDMYTNPFSSAPSLTDVFAYFDKTIGLPERIASGVLVFMAIVGCVFRLRSKPYEERDFAADSPRSGEKGLDKNVPPWLVGATCMVGLVAFSIVGCYAYYPAPEEVLEEIRIARGEALSAASSGDRETALHWISLWDEWSRRLEVGTAIRTWELRPYQQAQGRLLRKKLELLEHELEHDPLEPEEIRAIIAQLSTCSQRLSLSFRTR